jgi:hypothetical protein
MLHHASEGTQRNATFCESANKEKAKGARVSEGAMRACGGDTPPKIRPLTSHHYRT